MMRMVLAVAVVGLMGCVPTPDERQPLALERGTRELGCGAAETQTEYLGERLFRVTGCGRTATYRVICKITVASCYLIGGPDETPLSAR